jgi:hypothetical protein
MEDARLSRIEQKIDQLSEAVVSLARMEERMITLFKRMDSYDERQLRLESKITEMDTVITKRGVIYNIVDRGIWLVVGIVLAAYVKSFF